MLRNILYLRIIYQTTPPSNKICSCSTVQYSNAQHSTAPQSNKTAGSREGASSFRVSPSAEVLLPPSDTHAVAGGCHSLYQTNQFREMASYHVVSEEESCAWTANRHGGGVMLWCVQVQKKKKESFMNMNMAMNGGQHDGVLFWERARLDRLDRASIPYDSRKKGNVLDTRFMPPLL